MTYSAATSLIYSLMSLSNATKNKTDGFSRFMQSFVSETAIKPQH